MTSKERFKCAMAHFSQARLYMILSLSENHDDQSTMNEFFDDLERVCREFMKHYEGDDDDQG